MISAREGLCRLSNAVPCAVLAAASHRSSLLRPTSDVHRVATIHSRGHGGTFYIHVYIHVYIVDSCTSLTVSEFIVHILKILILR